MDKTRRIWLFVLVVGIISLLVIFFRDFLISLIVRPVALFVWAMWRVLAGVHQSLYWVALIIGLLVLIFRMFLSESEDTCPSAYPEQKASLGRIEYWQARLTSARFGEDGLQAFHHDLRKLLVSFLAQQERSNPADIEAAIRSRRLPLPPPVRPLFDPSAAHPDGGLEKLGRRLFLMLPLWARKWTAGPLPGQEDLLLPLLEWIESYLEIKHEN